MGVVYEAEGLKLHALKFLPPGGEGTHLGGAVLKDGAALNSQPATWLQSVVILALPEPHSCNEKIARG